MKDILFTKKNSQLYIAVSDGNVVETVRLIALGELFLLLGVKEGITPDMN